MLCLNCLVLGQVGTFRKAIKDKKSHQFSNVDANNVPLSYFLIDAIKRVFFLVLEHFSQSADSLGTCNRRFALGPGSWSRVWLAGKKTLKNNET